MNNHNYPIKEEEKHNQNGYSMERQQYDTILQNLKARIAFINSQQIIPFFLSEKAIALILEALSQLKQHILTHNFKTTQEEIYFFKEIKPRISSQTHLSQLHLQDQKPKAQGGKHICTKYYNNELRRLKTYFDNNFEFYKYYRTGNTLLDQHYFIRGKQDIRLNLDTYYFETDHQFATSPRLQSSQNNSPRQAAGLPRKSAYKPLHRKFRYNTQNQYPYCNGQLYTR